MHLGDRTDRLETLGRFAAAAALAEQLEGTPRDAGVAADGAPDPTDLGEARDLPAPRT